MIRRLSAILRQGNSIAFSSFLRKPEKVRGKINIFFSVQWRALSFFLSIAPVHVKLVEIGWNFTDTNKRIHKSSSQFISRYTPEIGFLILSDDNPIQTLIITHCLGFLWLNQVIVINECRKYRKQVENHSTYPWLFKTPQCVGNIYSWYNSDLKVILCCTGDDFQSLFTKHLTLSWSDNDSGKYNAALCFFIFFLWNSHYGVRTARAGYDLPFVLWSLVIGQSARYRQSYPVPRLDDHFVVRTSTFSCPVV